MIARRIGKARFPITELYVSGPDPYLRKVDLQIRIRPAPEQRQPGCPILSVNGLPRAGMFFRRQNARRCREFRPNHFPPHARGSDRNLGIVANALRLAHIAARHHVQLVTVFPEPYWGRDLCPVLAERGERHVFLAADRGRHCFGHADIVVLQPDSVGRWDFILSQAFLATQSCEAIAPLARFPAPLSHVVRPEAWPIDPALASVLKAVHAQMDA